MSENPQNMEFSDSQETSSLSEIVLDFQEEPIKEYLLNLKRSAEEKDEMIMFLRPPKMAKNEYMEQTPAKYVFQCSDGEIQIPEYGLLRTDFYYQERIYILAVTNCDPKII